MSNLGLIWRTIRHLRLIQIIYRVIFRLYKPRIYFGEAVKLRDSTSDWHIPICGRPVLTGPGQFLIFGHRHDVKNEGWNPSHLPKLLCYNLHYFNELKVQDVNARLKWHQELIAQWILENPPPLGNGWEPYPTSLRIVNWVKWAQLHPKLVSVEMVNSLAIQARYLEKRLEWHLLGNHLFANAKALMFAGLFFQGEEANRWVNTGVRIISRQLIEQILPDGGQFELSPMYHALALEDILDIISLTKRYSSGLTAIQAEIVHEWSRYISPMLTWLNAMTHPDDEISFFNDAAFGVAAKNSALRDYASRLVQKFSEPISTPCHSLPDSGYYRLQRGQAIIIADLASVGPNYLPAHAHADTLSFELSLATQRVIVNGGTGTYETGLERSLQRGTTAHSTLCLDGENSTEVWAGFRVGRRASVFDVEILEQTNETIIEASHDGYTHLFGSPLHRRRWTLTDKGLKLDDFILGKGTHNVEIFFHLHPDIEISLINEQSARMSSKNGDLSVDMTVSENAKLNLIRSEWHPEFGLKIPTQTICLTNLATLDAQISTTLIWQV
mgnify:CR=1 FL=1